MIATLICSLTKYTFFPKGYFDFPCFYCTYKVHYSEVSIAIVLGGANSGQTSIKCCDLACDAESTPLKNCEDFDIKLEVKHIFLISNWGANIYNYQLPEDLGMRKILVHGICMQKNPQTRANIFWIFTDLHGVMQVPSPTYTPAQKFNQWHC